MTNSQKKKRQNKQQNISHSNNNSAKKDEGEKIESGSDEKIPIEKEKPQINIPQPLVVQFDKKEGKGIKRSEIFSLIALFISLAAFVLNTCNYDTAKENFIFGKESTKMETRAYITMSKLQANGLKEDSLVTTDVSFLNVGKTPAFNLKGGVVLVYARNEKSINVDSIDKVEITNPTVTVPSNQSVTQGIYLPNKLTKSDIEILKKGEIKLYAIINSSYEDVFKEIHFFRGFFEYDFNEGKFYLCSRHNYGD